MKPVLSVLLILLVLLDLSPSARAQLLPPPLSISTTPSAPSPREEFTALASTPTFDKDTAVFEWTVDGKPLTEFSGFGKNEITLRAGEIGAVTTISVAVSRTNGERAQASLAVYPAGLSLPWTAETLIPKWYRGKALPAPGATVAVSAIPEIVIGGQRLHPENLIYRWTLDNERNTLVGVGKRVFRIQTSDFLRSTHQVEVVVEDIDGRIRKEGRVIIETASPRLAIYHSTPLGGVEPRVANLLATARRGLFDFAAEPFFLPTPSKKDLAFSWAADGLLVRPAAENPGLATIDTNRVESRTIPITASVKNLNPFLPSLSKILNLFLQ